MTSPADAASLLAWARTETWAMEQHALEAMTATLVGLARGQGDPDSLGGQGPPGRRVELLENGVAVIQVVGILSYKPGAFSRFFGGTTMIDLIADINAVAAAPRVKAILMVFDSPGGIAGGQIEAAAAIRAARLRKPVVAVVDPLAASAAFWLSSQASKIFITPSGRTGALGVFALHLSFAEQLRKAGIEPTFIASTPEKVEQSEALKLSDDAIAAAQREVDLIFAAFLADVARGRGKEVAQVRRNFGRGRLVNARDALRAGLVDRIGTIEQAMAGVLSLLQPATTPAGGAALLRSSLTPPRPSPRRRRLLELS